MQSEKYIMFNNYPDVVNIEQLTEMLDIGRNTAYKLIKSKQIKSVTIGKMHKIPKPYIIEYLQNIS